jgi:hypothetical protein
MLIRAGRSEAQLGYGKGKSEGGRKRGHSAMALWVTHQEAKTEARKRRRLAARRLERKVAKEAEGAGGAEASPVTASTISATSTAR